MEEDFYISLLYKKLNKSIDADEEKQLSDWIAHSEENKLLAQQVEFAWTESATLAASPHVDLDAAFSELEQKIAIEEKDSAHTPKSTGKTLPFRRNWVKIAAAVTFLLAAFLLGKDYLSPQAPVFTEIASTNDIKTVSLPDNSTVRLNKNSKISFPETFTGTERRIKLAGEGFFEVTHNPKQPFIVETPHETVTVLGTSFRVQAYQKDTQSLVQVATGKVSFRSKKSKKELVLTKNQKGILNKADGKMELIKSADPNEMAWGTKTIFFREKDIKEVFGELEAFYQVKFEIKNPEIYTCTFTGTFIEEDLSIVLETISETVGLLFKKKNNQTYQVTGGACK